MATRRAFAQEDSNLATASVATSRQKQYKDIDLSFTAKASGEIFKKTDAAAVKQAVKTLILTNLLEKPFNPFFGGDIRSKLFELADNQTGTQIRRNIIQQVKEYEPRATITDLKVIAEPDRNSIDVTIQFKINNTGETVEFTTTLARLR
jgi:phage baseplate assembly protein W